MNKHRINKAIRAEEVRLLDQDGEMLGVVPLLTAMIKAKEAGVDLVEVSPKAVPPVCRIINYGKMLYAEQKKAQAQKKATKKLEIKGIRLTFRMADGDAERQGKHAREFLEGGHTVRVQLTMRGREKAHRNMAVEKMIAFADTLKDIASLDARPKMGGNQVIAILRPTQEKPSEKKAKKPSTPKPTIEAKPKTS